MIWARMLAYITGTVDQELLLRNEYLATENRILRAKIKGRLLLSDSEKTTLAEIAHRLGRKALAEVAAAAKPDTLLRWYRELIAKKFDGSKFRKSVEASMITRSNNLTIRGHAIIYVISKATKRRKRKEMIRV
jgi:putative transposase